jgi:hypothetical protein
VPLVMLVLLVDYRRVLVGLHLGELSAALHFEHCLLQYRRPELQLLVV